MQIRAVLVTRERDFRDKMVAGNYMHPTDTVKVRSLSCPSVCFGLRYIGGVMFTCVCAGAHGHRGEDHGREAIPHLFLHDYDVRVGACSLSPRSHQHTLQACSVAWKLDHGQHVISDFGRCRPLTRAASHEAMRRLYGGGGRVCANQGFVDEGGIEAVCPCRHSCQLMRRVRTWGGGGRERACAEWVGRGRWSACSNPSAMCWT